ncbi:MAG: aminopeptidase [Planctomycetaceae bacterium]|nr:MAG: aminopeptidase [Planctomycetaceae bacterium]
MRETLATVRRTQAKYGFTYLYGLGAWLSVVSLCWGGERQSAPHQQLQHDAHYLASDELEGRGVGTSGLEKAAHYIKQQFAQAGLDVTRVAGDAFQRFTVISGVRLLGDPELILVSPSGESWNLHQGTDYEVCSFGGSVQQEGELVFVGYAIDSEYEVAVEPASTTGEPPSAVSPANQTVTRRYNDFSQIDVQGKWVLAFRYGPRQSADGGPFGPRSSRARVTELASKLLEAQKRGAAGIIFVNPPYSSRKKQQEWDQQLRQLEQQVLARAEELTVAPAEQVSVKLPALKAAVEQWRQQRQQTIQPDELMRFGYAGYAADDQRIPAAHLKQEVIEHIVSQTLNKSLAQLETAIDAELVPQSAVLPGWKVRARWQLERVKSSVANVIGVLEGQGPLAQETIVIGAHYDHLGRGGANSLAPGSQEIHNGADDNASGTVALLELARRFAARRSVPRRLVFIAFTAEEMGLLGSAHYVKEPIFPLEQTIAMFNLDMVGRLQDNKLMVYGSGTSTRWKDLITRCNQATQFQLGWHPEGFGPSDHSSFYGKKIPVIHLFTGLHPDYHKPSDDWDKLNYEGMVRVIELMECLIADTMQQPERPDYVEVKGRPVLARTGSRPYLGTIPDFSSDQPGYALSGTTAGSPAERGGLKAGDRIIKLGDYPVTGLEDFDLALRKYKAGDEITIVVVREGKQVELRVTLAPPR